MKRYCRQLASHGFLVLSPSSYHDFIGPEPLKYNDADTDRGNQLKISKTVQSYDADAKAVIDFAQKHSSSNGRIATSGMCLGGHLSFRAGFDPRVEASICFFPTDIHSHTLGLNKNDDTLDKVDLLQGTELLLIFGKKDTHVSYEGRSLIRDTLTHHGVQFSFYEHQWAQHAFIRDESSKGRFDASLTNVCFMMGLELLERTIALDRGKPIAIPEPEHVC